MDSTRRRIIEAMQDHADELEKRGERHVYGPAIACILLLEEQLAEALRRHTTHTME